MKKEILSLGFGALVGGMAVSLIKKNKKSKEYKFKTYYNILNQWIILKQEDKKIETYFIKKGYKNVAIYGMGELGNRLYQELKNTSVVVKYAIDKNAVCMYSELDMFSLDDELKTVDAVVVTPAFEFDRIFLELDNRKIGDIISIEDVIFEF